MLSLKQRLDDTIEIEGKLYEFDFSYDNVLRWYELMEDEEVNELGKIEFAFRMFILNCPNVGFETKIATIKGIANYLAGKSSSDSEDEDKTEGYEDEDSFNDNKQYFSFEEDAGYIYASFQQEYGIDLIDLQGKLRWEKFIALLNGMRENTKFNQIVSIRAAELPTGNDDSSKAERERLIRLKDIYQLKSNVSVLEEQMDSMFNSLMSFTKGGNRNG